MVNIDAILLILGSILSRIANLLLVPTLYALATSSEGVVGLLQSFAVIYLASLFLLRHRTSFTFSLRRRDMFIVTTLVWIVACVFGALPFILVLDISFTDAFFETMSGFTTTGYSLLAEPEKIPPAILLWRSLLQWMGGSGL